VQREFSMLLRSASENQKVCSCRWVSVFEGLNFVPTRPASSDSPHFTVPPPFWFHTQNRYHIPQNGCLVCTVLARYTGDTSHFPSWALLPPRPPTPIHLSPPYSFTSLPPLPTTVSPRSAAKWTFIYVWKSGLGNESTLTSIIESVTDQHLNFDR